LAGEWESSADRAARRARPNGAQDGGPPRFAAASRTEPDGVAALQLEVAELHRRIERLEKNLKDRTRKLDDVTRRFTRLERRIERASATFPVRTVLVLRRRLHQMLK
jgi:predicted RNase H-like nuclease (RuvC/YqgF family)